jgi:uncharacterized protein YeaO (DUF488 family)
MMATRRNRSARSIDVKTKSAREPAAAADGDRVLVDRLWPRGVSKEEARIDEWAKEVAPSDELRRRFAHEASRFDDFRRRYVTELQERREQLTELRRRARRGRLTLVYGARDPERNNAVVLADVLRRGLRS